MKANCDLTFLAFFHGVSEKGYTMDAEKETAGEERGAQLGDLIHDAEFPLHAPCS